VYIYIYIFFRFKQCVDNKHAWTESVKHSFVTQQGNYTKKWRPAAYVTSIDFAAHTRPLRFHDTIYSRRPAVTDDNYKNNSCSNQAEKFQRYTLQNYKHTRMRNEFMAET